MPAFESAISAGLGLIRAASGSAVTYSRGATTFTVSHAVQGETRKGVIDVGGSEQIVEMVDWLIKVSDLSALSDTPDPGDLITRVQDGTSYVWTVEDREIGEPHWDWSDNGKTQYRIRTRKDGSGAYEVSQPSGFDLAGNEVRAD